MEPDLKHLEHAVTNHTQNNTIPIETRQTHKETQTRSQQESYKEPANRKHQRDM